jgi:hypothetical protein
MSIRKTGAAEGRITEVDTAQGEQISATAGRLPEGWPQDYEAAPVTWDDLQEQGLAAENEAADQ